MVSPNTSKMEYRYLGNTGLRVSVLSFGTWVNNADDKLVEDCVKVSLEHGVNFFDTAEIYGLGQAELALGKAFKNLKVPREKIVVSTKIYSIGKDPNDAFQSRKHIIEGINNSLKRLQLDYVDVIFCHRYDMNTPLEETCRAMNYVIDKGLAFYWGTSQWTASQIMEAYKICDKLIFASDLEDYGYIYVTEDKDVIVDNNIKNIFEKIQTNQFKKDRQRYQLINDYCDAAINLYGICSINKIIEIINEQNNINVTKEEMEYFLSSTFLDIECENGYFYESRIPILQNSDLFYQNIKFLFESQSSKPYYVPAKEEFLKYKDLFYFEKNKEYNNLHKYIYKKTCNKNLTDMICTKIHQNCSDQKTFDDLEEFNVLFDSDEDAQIFIDMIVKLSNNTRLKSNRGHTPLEISKLKSNLTSQTHKKIGRNDLCPCGSGKKYKKCCGK